MAGMYGAETPGGRYRLSFTVGGLLAPQGRIIASLFVRNGFPEGPVADETDATVATDEVAGAVTSGNVGGKSQELGERIARIRRQALDENVLSIRTQAANTRMVSEVCKRLSALTETEIRYLADSDAPAADCRALMWVAMCRYYALIGEFANEVLRDHYLMGVTKVTYGDYDRFILDKAMWHVELEEMKTTTANKLRSNMFRAMGEAGLMDADDNTLLPSLLGRTVTGILDNRPESFLFFPLRNR